MRTIHRLLGSLTLLIAIVAGPITAQARPEIPDSTPNHALESTFLVEVFLDTAHTMATTGTAFLGPHHKLYTAQHLFARPFVDIVVFDSQGRHVGEAMLDHPYHDPAVDTAEAFALQDSTTMTLVQFDEDNNPLAEDRFATTPELTIAANPSMAMVAIDGPIGMLDGGSGAPVMNEHGEVIGVVSGTNAPTPTNSMTVDISTFPSVFPQDGSNPIPVTVPVISHVYTAPLVHDTTNATPIPLGTQVYIAAYPRQRAIIYRGHTTSLEETQIRLTSFEKKSAMPG